MSNSSIYDVIIIGGSFAGLSAAMTLGRSLRKTLIIDSGKPCNIQTPHAHNLITHDGSSPSEISSKAKQQVLKYPTVKYKEGLALNGRKLGEYFEITLESGEIFSAKKVIFATGVKDVMPDIPGFADCWGKSIVHCPYCHGYEIKGQKTGILINGAMAYHLATIVSNLTHELTIYTNGPANFTAEQKVKLEANNIHIDERKVLRFEQQNGRLSEIIFEGLRSDKIQALYAKPAIIQHCTIPEEFGCELNENELLSVDVFQKTSIDGIYACGDNTTMGRSLAMAISQGNFTGAAVNMKLAEELF